MSIGIPNAGDPVWLEGQQITAVFIRTSDTTATISWNIPAIPLESTRIYYGAIVLVSSSELNVSNYPTNGVTYNASADLSAPADKIGSAQVVGAFYNDVTTHSVDITNLDPSLSYYASVNLSSNVKTYYSIGSKTYPDSSSSDAYAGNVPNNYGPPTSPTMGEIYYDLSNHMMFAWNGTQWDPMTDHAPASGDTSPDQGNFVGDIFYNITYRQLQTWNGAEWKSAEPDDTRAPMYDKLNVGTDLTSSERNQLIQTLKYQLGYPLVCTNLTDQHFNIAVDNAIQQLRTRADNAYFRQYLPILMQPNMQTIYLNDPTNGSNRVVDVMKVHRLNIMGMSTVGESGLYGQTFLNQLFYPGAQVDLTTIYMIHQYAELFSLVFAGDIAFSWRETTRQLTLFRKAFNEEKILIEVSMEKTEQELLQDRYLMQWIQQWATAEAMMMQGRIRSKYTSLPGPGGGLSLNGADLIQQANEYFEDCNRQVMDMEIGNGAEFGNYSFTMG